MACKGMVGYLYLSDSHAEERLQLEHVPLVGLLAACLDRAPWP